MDWGNLGPLAGTSGRPGSALRGGRSGRFRLLRVRGEAKPESDPDLLVDFLRSVSLLELVGAEL